MWWWWDPDDDDAVLSKYDDDDVLIEISEYDDELMLEYDDVRLMIFLIKRLEAYDNDDSDWNIRMWWWWYFDADILMMMMLMFWWCFHDDVSDWKIRVWWWCCCLSKGQSAKEVVADQKAKVLKKMLLIERSKCWRWCC